MCLWSLTWVCTYVVYTRVSWQDTYRNCCCAYQPASVVSIDMPKGKWVKRTSRSIICNLHDYVCVCTFVFIYFVCLYVCITYYIRFRTLLLCNLKYVVEIVINHSYDFVINRYLYIYRVYKWQVDNGRFKELSKHSSFW